MRSTLKLLLTLLKWSQKARRGSSHSSTTWPSYRSQQEEIHIASLVGCDIITTSRRKKYLFPLATPQPIRDCHNSANEKLLCFGLPVFFNGLFVINSPSRLQLLYKRVTFVSLELHIFCHSGPNYNFLLSSKSILLINSVIVSFFKVNRSLSVDLIYLKIIY